MSTAYQRLIEALERHGCRRTGRTDWTCPAHDDERASLSASAAVDRALLHCHAGCDPEDVLAALGLHWSDLFDGEHKSGMNIVATYDYHDPEGTLLYQVVRTYPKGFRQRRPDGNGGWVWNMNGIRRVLYHLPHVLEAVREGKPVYVVEGEKDVHALERVGVVATTNPGGAGKWRSEFAEDLRGAEIVVVADADRAGQDHARQVVTSLEGVAAFVRVVEPAEGKDASDHLGAGRTLEELVSVVDHRPGRWTRAADVRAEPVKWLWEGRIPHGMVTVIGGFPGVGKSTILHDVAARVSQLGKTVLVVTAEDHLAMVARPRLEAAGADLERVHFLTEPLTLPEDASRLGKDVRDMDASLLILDPLVAFIGDEVNTHRDHHVRRVLAPLADLAESTGVAVLVVIHTNKAAGNEPLMRISGSIGFTGAARSVLLAADDPQDEGRRILAVVKNNLAAYPPPWAYTIVGVELPGGIRTSKIHWTGEAPEVDPRELLMARDPEERSAREEAEALIREAGVLKAPRLASELQAAAQAQGISEKTLQRARRSLHVPAWPDGFGGAWYWGPRPRHGLDTQSGQPHPGQTVQTGDDLGKHLLDPPVWTPETGLGKRTSAGPRRSSVRSSRAR